jgi:HlyD family secretion protein
MGMPKTRDSFAAILEPDTQRRERPASVLEMPPVQPLRSRQSRKPLYRGLAAILLLVAAVLIWRATRAPAAPAFGTVPVQRAQIAKTISATGKLQALTTVQVGTQVSGRISEIYADFNTQVKKGQVIARLDPSQLQAQLTQANANYASAQANIQTAENSILSADAGVEGAQANVDRMDSVYRDAEATLNRTRELVAAGAAARKDLQSSEAAFTQAAAQRQQAISQLNQAKAQAQSARSQLTQARAQAQQSQASVQLASVNMENSVIRAPIDGVVIERNVDVGQTVAASLQAPVLFVIANDLTRMQVLADIDEADVGQLAEDSRVTFTVDAFPNDTFGGRISQVRLAPQAEQNVVTYTAVIEVENPELKLKPGMTATVTAIVDERENALSVPNAALRFRPESAGSEPRANRPGGGAVVWKVEGQELKPVRVRLGLSDGISSEVVSGDLKEGDVLAVAAAQARTSPAPAGASPFQMRRGGGGLRR